MTGGSEEWRLVLEPARWVICRIAGPEQHSEAGRAWRRLEGADARPAEVVLTILVGWGGGGRYHHTEVVETDREVRIEALIERRVPVTPDPGIFYARTLELNTGIVEVHLAAPLGERALLGAAAADDPVGRLLRSERSFPADASPLQVVRPPTGGGAPPHPAT
jgi:hypothetical protein